MFLPIGDSPNLPKTPWLTWALIVLNVGVFLAIWPQSFQPVNRNDPVLQQYLRVLAEERGAVPQTVSQADLVRFEHGVKPGSFTLADAFTSMFLHGGWMHLIGNMLFLWIFGDNVEHRLGRFGFLLAYLGTGLVATGGDALLRAGSDIPSVGASGAISGVLGLYFIWFPRNQVRVFLFLFPFLVDVVELPARLVLGFYLVIDNLLPLLITGGAGGVSHGAHIGGFIAGWMLARGLGRGETRPTWHDGTRRSEAPSSAPTPLRQRFRDALIGGRLREATDLLFTAPRDQSRSEITYLDKVELAEALAEAGEPRAALAAYQRALADNPRGPGRARAHLGAARLQLHAFGSPTAAYQHLYAAMEEGPEPEEVAAARTLLAEIERGSRSLPRRRW